MVRSRADVVAALQEAGFEVPRQGEDYLTARDPDSGMRCRMKGALYEQDFEPGLDARLRSRLETDRRQIEETVARELRRLGKRSRAVANDALQTIEADTAARPRAVLGSEPLMVPSGVTSSTRPRQESCGAPFASSYDASFTY